MGFDVEFVEAVPVVGRPGIRVAGQARVHPRKYLGGLARALAASGVRIHEHSEVTAFADDAAVADRQRPQRWRAATS